MNTVFDYALVIAVTAVAVVMLGKLIAWLMLRGD